MGMPGVSPPSSTLSFGQCQGLSTAVLQNHYTTNFPGTSDLLTKKALIERKKVRKEHRTTYHASDDGLGAGMSQNYFRLLRNYIHKATFVNKTK